MGDYFEEIWDRAETQFSSRGRMIAWLSSFENPARGANAYTNDAVSLRNSLVSAEKIQDDVSSARTLRQVKSIQDDANSLIIKDLRDESLGLINDRIRVLEGEAEEEKAKFKEAELVAEREEAEERLRELSPQALGGIKSGEKRRGKRAFREMFAGDFE